ncbi:MAG: hypothetical protein BMS9Abin37_1924 [Acidobacteriota bacterium]|nr:MAG: hypothetical protein BMS9Abin37_1924 [Acidobacteriota bacterium]
MKQARDVFLIFSALSLLTGLALAEVVYLNNGDIVHGELVAANNTQVTLKTAYGELEIPKKDILRIDYQGGEAPAPPAPPKEDTRPARPPKRAAVPGDRAQISLSITGRSFWYAFESPEDNPADTRIRLRLYIGSARACTFIDEKPDTVDGATLYNSFTFSPTDSRLVETLEGFQCSVQEAEDGQVRLIVQLPAEVSSGRQLVRMLYEVNQGDRSFPRWLDVISRSFSVEVEAGRETDVIIEQNAAALDYSGFFKKSMKNLELFQLNVLSSELRD